MSHEQIKEFTSCERKGIDVEHMEVDVSGIPSDIIREFEDPVNLENIEVAKDPRTQSLLMRMKQHPWVVRASVIGGAAVLAVQPVAADASVNWTSIGDMLDGLSTMMPSVSNLVMAVVPVLIILLIVGFITGLLDGIIDAIRSGTKLFK